MQVAQWPWLVPFLVVACRFRAASESTGRWVLRPWRAGASVTCDEDCTCAASTLPHWHTFRETARTRLEPVAFAPAHWVEEPAWRELLDWWYDFLKEEAVRSPGVADCPVGRLFMSTLAFAIDGPGDRAGLIRLLCGAWRSNVTVLDVLASSWPLFELFARVSRSEESGLSQGDEGSVVFDGGIPNTRCCTWQMLLLSLTTGDGDGDEVLSAAANRISLNNASDGEAGLATARLLLIFTNPELANPPSNRDALVPHSLRELALGLGTLSRSASWLLTPPGALAALLHAAQTKFVSRLPCPEGTRLVPARTLGSRPFRLCVRENNVGIDAAAILYGDWATCTHLRSAHRDLIGPLPTDDPLELSRCMIVDVGPHIGLCALAFAAHGCFVIAVDIQQEHINMITHSAVVSGLTENIVAVQGAVTDADGGWLPVHGSSQGLAPQNFYVGSGVMEEPNAAAAELAPHGVAVAANNAAPRLSVDELLRRVGVPPEEVTLLKIDAEGHDLHVLKGATGMLRMHRSWRRERARPRRTVAVPMPPLVVFELDNKGLQRYGEDASETVSWLEARRFNVTLIKQSINHAIRLA